MMDLNKSLSQDIVRFAHECLGHEFCWTTFNCVHFVRRIYSQVGIEFPLLIRDALPPQEFHLTVEEFEKMPVGHSVFFKRRMSSNQRRSWTHVAIIAEGNTLVHCTRNLGVGVVLTPKAEFLEVYKLTS